MGRRKQRQVLQSEGVMPTGIAGLLEALWRNYRGLMGGPCRRAARPGAAPKKRRWMASQADLGLSIHSRSRRTCGKTNVLRRGGIAVHSLPRWKIPRWILQLTF